MGIDVLQLASYIYPILIVLIVLEYFTAKHLYDLKESASSFGIAIVSTLIATFTKAWALALFAVLFVVTKELRMELLGYESLGWHWYIWVLCIIGDDFNFYWHHRLSHNIRVLWAAHSPHHNANTFNLTVSIRNGWFITLYKPVFWLWMPLLGFEPAMIASALVINAVYQFFLHSEKIPSLGPIEWVFNTAWVHRVHHSSNIPYLDKNHGGILVIWDRLFGTFQDVIPGVKEEYGVLKNEKLNSYNPISANTHEFVLMWQDVKRAPTFSDKLKYIFYPPGWSHDGSTKTAKEMQREFEAA